MYFIPKQVQFHLYILHGWLETWLRAPKVENHHFWPKCLNLMVKTLPSKSTEHKSILDEVLNLIIVSTAHLDASWQSLHNKQVYILLVGFIQHTCSSKVSWLVESNTTFSSISVTIWARSFQQTLLNFCCLQVTLKNLCQVRCPQFFWVLYQINWTSLITYYNITYQ